VKDIIEKSIKIFASSRTTRYPKVSIFSIQRRASVNGQGTKKELIPSVRTAYAKT